MDEAKVEANPKHLNVSSGQTTQVVKQVESTKVTDPKVAQEPVKVQTALDGKAQTKMDRATELFRQMSMNKDVQRKDIVERFMNDIGLTKAGAGTYYQLIKQRFPLISHAESR